MAKCRLTYGIDPLAAAHGQRAFFWPTNAEVRQQAEMVRRARPDVFELTYQGNPVAAAKIRRARKAIRGQKTP